MALSLTANQRSIMDIFVNENMFIIPSYQRAYSWGYDHISKLYSDILNAFLEKSDEKSDDYFIGNLILAVGKDNKYEFHVVDGQQRLITIWILMKVCYLLFPEMAKLSRILSIQDWTDEELHPRIRSDVFESNDNEDLNEINTLTLKKIEQRTSEVTNKKGEVQRKFCHSNMEYNALTFYGWMKYRINSQGKEKTRAFVRYIIENVYLLPIELYEDSADKAELKALKIFETLNDRGLSLEDADLFKEKLYRRSIIAKENKQFINLWVELKNSCDKQEISLDDLFRFYSHIIRGRNRINGNEQSLRDFFIDNSDSPLETMDYQQVIEELNLILKQIQYVSSHLYDGSELSAWLQLIVGYSNQYPFYALICYLFKHDEHKDKENIIELAKSLVRYCYYRGSTTTVKFEIYNIIVSIMNDERVKHYAVKDMDLSSFPESGRLKNNYILLDYYIQNKSGLKAFDVDRILTYRDLSSLSNDWSHADTDEAFEQLGNLILIDVNKRYLPFNSKCAYYSKSKLKEVKELFKRGNLPTYHQFLNRDKEIKLRLIQFFRRESYA